MKWYDYLVIMGVIVVTPFIIGHLKEVPDLRQAVGTAIDMSTGAIIAFVASWRPRKG